MIDRLTGVNPVLYKERSYGSDKNRYPFRSEVGSNQNRSTETVGRCEGWHRQPALWAYCDRPSRSREGRLRILDKGVSLTGDPSL